MTTDPTTEEQSSKGGGTRVASSLVAVGILLSRFAGLIREGVFSKYFGTTLYADVFRAGIRMPNLLQNLLGEGTLSASFIPVYSELLEQGREKEAGHTAGAIFGILLMAAGILSLLGVIMAPVLVSVLAPGFQGERRELSIAIVRIIFPGTGIMVLSAWALGILNSHRKFFVSYVAPVAWNGAIIATLIFFGGRMSLDRLVIALGWGTLVGGILQFVVQLPWVLRLEKELRPSLNFRLKPVQEALRNAGPAILGRGVVQVSGYLDIVLASLLAAGAVSMIGYAQTLYMLPISLFGMSVAAAELPELSRQRGAGGEELRLRTGAALERIAFFVVPSFVAIVALGDVAVAMLYQRGEFARADTLVVYFTLVAFSLGLIASTGTRLFSSTFFALRDTKTPARFAAVRVFLSAGLGFLFMTQFEAVPELGIDGGIFSGVNVDGRSLGAVGLALGSGIAAWVEWGLLKRRLKSRIGAVSAGAAKLTKMFVAAGAGAGAGWAVRLVVNGGGPIVRGILVFAAFGITYFAIASLLKLSEAQILTRRLRSIVARS